MRRRSFIGLVGGAFARPIAVLAQQHTTMRRIGYVSTGFEGAPNIAAWTKVFEQELAGLGWTVGKNLAIERRYGAVDPGVRDRAARELVALKPDAILAVTPVVAVALLKETHAIPIVFIDGPEQAAKGMVTDFAHPGGNLTGFINFVDSIFGKWLQLLKEIAPQVSRVAYMFNPESTTGFSYAIGELEAAARTLNIAVAAAPVSERAGIEAVIGALTGDQPGGAIVLPGPYVSQHRLEIFDAANKHRVPVIHPFPYYARDGGLIAYGVDQADLYRGAAGYVDRILRGEKVADLPVQAPTRFTLAVNTRAAKAAGIDIPQSILVRADEIIE